MLAPPRFGGVMDMIISTYAKVCDVDDDTEDEDNPVITPTLTVDVEESSPGSMPMC